MKAILGNFILAFQICLGLWQFFKLTPLGALLQGVVGCLLCPLGLSPSYARLRYLQGRLFKRVRYSYVFEDLLESPERGSIDDDEIRLSYLGMDFDLERRGTDKNIMFVKGKMGKLCYYITPRIWNELAHTASELDKDKLPNAVFVENYKEIWVQVATCRVMTVEEVLDHIILDRHTPRLLEGTPMLLPVDLSVSEEKILKMLNLAGFFLQTKKVYWLIPLLLSFTSTVLEFSTPLRKWIYEKINVLFCSAMHVICDPLPRPKRSHIYLGLGKFVENLKPTNDIKLKVTKGNITATIAGGAKVHTEGALTLLPWFDLHVEPTEVTFHCDNIDIKCRFETARGLCFISATTFGEIYLACNNQSRFLRILTLVWSIAKNGSGSLKSYGPHRMTCFRRRVCVRGLMETLHTYVSSGCPYVYEMELENVVVN